MLDITQKSDRLVHQQYPSLIKYMGSKSKIMDFVLEGINQVYDGGIICDLFSGSASLAGALGQQASVHSNDIQSYSGVLADTYSQAYLTPGSPTAQILVDAAAEIISSRECKNCADYSTAMTILEFNEIESIQKGYIDQNFDYDWHLFVRNYSGTWWSYEQCLWIDALREVAERFKNDPVYPAILSSLIFAMAYASQGTGHYAQYRDAKTQSSFKDIVIYRKRSIAKYFVRKYSELLDFIPAKPTKKKHRSTSLDFKDCLEQFGGGTVYADPPYCFVHYSRFYHALETLVLYDYPNIQMQNGEIVKGRYREKRHQSPFCIKSQVQNAFKDLFHGINLTNSHLVLSYSNTGMISLEDLHRLAKENLPTKKIEIMTIDHHHMTMGRKGDRQRNIKESLLLAY